MSELLRRTLSTSSGATRRGARRSTGPGRSRSRGRGAGPNGRRTPTSGSLIDAGGHGDGGVLAGGAGRAGHIRDPGPPGANPGQRAATVNELGAGSGTPVVGWAAL